MERSRFVQLLLNKDFQSKLLQIGKKLLSIISEIFGLIVLINDVLTFIKIAQGTSFYIPLLWRIPFLPSMPSLWRILP